LEALANNGIQLLSYHGDNIYTLSVPANTSKNKLSLVATVADITAESKLGNLKDISALPDYASYGSQAKLIIMYPEDIDYQSMLSLMRDENIEVIRSNAHDKFMEILIDKTRLDYLLNLPFVLGVESVAPPAVREDKGGRNLHRVNLVNGVGAVKNYDGAGINVLVRDDGKVFNHLDFTGRVDQSFSGPSRGDHGDGVAGIMSGSGNIDVDFAGMAPGSFMYVNDYTSGFLDETIDLHLDNNVTVTNSSYSDGCNGGYTFGTRTVDRQMLSHPTLMHVFSAGNSNNNDCGYGAGDQWGNITGGHKIGKNVIATANLDVDGGLAPSSSIGPASDGRIKPDISAHGRGHNSTAERQDYMSFGGTSAAAPVVAGVFAVLQQAYKELYEEEASAALLKGVILNTANEIGNIGPDFKFGWGIINAHRAVRVLEEGRFMTASINNGEINTHEINVPAGTKHVKVMTYWHDREGFTSNQNHLFLDLNTTLTKDGVTHMPWVLNSTPEPTLLNMPAAKGKDTKNNMEQVAIDNPEAGVYTLTIDATETTAMSGEYHVIYEFLSEDIEITYPNGNENIERRADEFIQWEAYGNEGNFLIEIIDEQDNVLKNVTVNGDQRLKSLRFPNGYGNNLKVRISRDGQVDVSDAVFRVSKHIEDVTLDTVAGQKLITWSPVDSAISYNVYRIGEKYMEIIDQVDSNLYMIPSDADFEFTWYGFSANFDEGPEGHRSRSVSSRLPPNPIITENTATPCVLQPYTFNTDNTDSLASYLWQFGIDSSPDTLFSKGPHEVVYTKRGQKVVILTITHDGGSRGVGMVVDVQRNPEGDDISFSQEANGVYTFTSNAERVEDYVWDFGDGTTGTGATVEHAYAQTGTFTVSLVAEGDCGIVTISEQVTVTLVDVEDIEIGDFDISPNPSNGHFVLSIPDLEGSDLTAKIFSMDGKLVYNTELSSSKANSSLKIGNESMSAGVYQLTLEFAGKKLTEKLIVR